MRKIVILIFIYTLTHIRLSAQESQGFIGTYLIQEICFALMLPGYSDTSYYGIKIEPSTVDTFDIQYYLPFIQDTIRATIINDSAFLIPTQTFLASDSTLIYISGNGFVIKDSLKINYGAGGSRGLFDCYCKGRNKNATGIFENRKESSRIMVFPNPVQQILNFDLELSQNENQGISIRIYSLKGALIMKDKLYNGNLMIDVSGLKPGTYFYSVLNGFNEYSGLFIKE
jgi:hypothetical protein